MTSKLVQNRGLSPQTLDAHRRCRANRYDADERLWFLLTYLEDVVPWGITVHHIPGDRTDGKGENAREGIQLQTPSGMIFMSGLVSTESGQQYIEPVAAGEAYSKWDLGYFVPDGENWRFFLGAGPVGLISFFNSRQASQGDDWELKYNFETIDSAAELAAYLQQEFDSLAPEARL